MAVILFVRINILTPILFFNTFPQFITINSFGSASYLGYKLTNQMSQLKKVEPLPPVFETFDRFYFTRFPEVEMLTLIDLGQSPFTDGIWLQHGP